MWSEESVKRFWEQNKASFAGDVKAKEILRLSKPYRKGRILDVGSGSGALIDALLQREESVIGVDLIVRHPRVKQASVADLPFSGGEFDTVYATDVLEHLTDDVLAKGLAEIWRVMRDTARFIAVLPYNEVMEQNSVSCPQCGVSFHRWGHVQSFDKSGLTELMTTSGFHVIKLVALPLGIMAEHWLVRHFWRLFVLLTPVKLSDYFTVLEKRG